MAQDAAAAGAHKGIPVEYEVLHRCGEGTFGQVFLCANKDGKHVAIKTIKQETTKQARNALSLSRTFQNLPVICAAFR